MSACQEYVPLVCAIRIEMLFKETKKKKKKKSK